jgi:hypothetical protein
VLFHSTGEEGELWSYYHPIKAGPVILSVEKANAHLDHSDSLQVTVQLSNISLQAAPGAITGVKLDVAINANAQVKVWSNFGLPIGGGAGSSIGTDTSAAVKAEGSLVVTGSGDKTMLTAIVAKPDKATFKVDLHLGPLGTHSLNIDVGMPHTPLFSAPIPTGLENELEVKVADKKISRLVRLEDIKVESSDRAITISGNIKLLASNSEAKHSADKPTPAETTSTALVYAIADSGDMLFYKHAGAADGSATWPIQAKKIGSGWNFKQVFAGDNGAIYAVTAGGDLLFYKHAGAADGSPTWPIQAKKIGSGWDFKQVFAGDNGAIYAVTAGGDMLFYKHAGTADGSPTWPIQAKKIGSGWDFKQVFIGR